MWFLAEYRSGHLPHYPVYRDLARLAPNVVEYPNTAGGFGDAKNELRLSKRERRCRNFSRNHEFRALQRGNSKRFTNRLALGWIETNSPNVEETSAAGNEVNCLPVWRPARFIVPVFAIGKRDPSSARRRHDIQHRLDAFVCICHGL